MYRRKPKRWIWLGIGEGGVPQLFFTCVVIAKKVTGCLADAPSLTLVTSEALGGEYPCHQTLAAASSGVGAFVGMPKSQHRADIRPHKDNIMALWI